MIGLFNYIPTCNFIYTPHIITMTEHKYDSLCATIRGGFTSVDEWIHSITGIDKARFTTMLENIYVWDKTLKEYV